MTDREKFEVWASIEGLVDYELIGAWRAWQASRKHALKEAKEKCMSHAQPSPLTKNEIIFSNGVWACLTEIEDLANPEGEQG